MENWKSSFHNEMTAGKDRKIKYMPKTQQDLDSDILQVFEDVSTVATALKGVIDPLNAKIAALQAQNDTLTAKLNSIGANPPPADPIDFTPETDQLDKIHAGLQALAASPNGDMAPATTGDGAPAVTT